MPSVKDAYDEFEDRIFPKEIEDTYGKLEEFEKLIFRLQVTIQAVRFLPPAHFFDITQNAMRLAFRVGMYEALKSTIKSMDEKDDPDTKLGLVIAAQNIGAEIEKLENRNRTLFLGFMDEAEAAMKKAHAAGIGLGQAQ